MSSQRLQSDQIGELTAALCKAQAEIGHASKESVNSFYKNKYATYETMRDECRDPLSKNGLALTHLLDIHEGKRVMVTQLSHISGQWMRSIVIMPQEKEDPQSVGKAITYSKRYSMGALLAMGSDEDDDGESIQKPYRESDGQKPTLHLNNAECLSSSQCDAIKKAVNGDYAYLNKIVKEHKKDCVEKLPAAQFSHIMNLIKLREEERQNAKTGT